MRYQQIWDYLFKITMFDEYGQHPADEDSIRKAGNALKQDLNKNGFKVPGIPEEYAEFLKMTNGYEWNGFRLFGSKPFKFNDGYSLCSIYERNLYYRENRHIMIDNYLVLGDFDEDLFIYSGDGEKYMVVDDLTFIPIDSYDSFEDLLLDNLQTLYLDTIEDDTDLFDEYMRETGQDEYFDNLPEDDAEV